MTSLSSRTTLTKTSTTAGSMTFRDGVCAVVCQPEGDPQKGIIVCAWWLGYVVPWLRDNWQLSQDLRLVCTEAPWIAGLGCSILIESDHFARIAETLWQTPSNTDKSDIKSIIILTSLARIKSDFQLNTPDLQCHLQSPPVHHLIQIKNFPIFVQLAKTGPHAAR